MSGRLDSSGISPCIYNLRASPFARLCYMTVQSLRKCFKRWSNLTSKAWAQKLAQKYFYYVLLDKAVTDSAHIQGRKYGLHLLMGTMSRICSHFCYSFIPSFYKEEITARSSCVFFNITKRKKWWDRDKYLSHIVILIGSVTTNVLKWW